MSRASWSHGTERIAKEETTERTRWYTVGIDSEGMGELARSTVDGQDEGRKSREEDRREEDGWRRKKK